MIEDSNNIDEVVNHVLHKETTRAVIDAKRCIGCFKCIRACPVEAIVGSPQLMHTIIEKDCIGCDLCISACPVDCIENVDSNNTHEESFMRNRFSQKQQRLAKMSNYEKEIYAEHTFQDCADPLAAKKAAIQAALQRVKEKSGHRDE